MNNQEKQRAAHLLILICYTILSCVLIGESLLLGWEKWAVVLLPIGVIAGWTLHIRDRLAMAVRLDIYTVLMMLVFFFYGIHETSMFDLAPVMITLMVLYSSTERYNTIKICMFTYYLTMTYDFFLAADGFAEDAPLFFTRLLLHLMLVYMAGRLLKVMTERRVKERKTTEDMIIRLEEINRRTEDFLANVSHELRTPINAVTGISSVMLKNEEDPEKKKDLFTIQMAGQRLFGQIEDILDYTEIDNEKISVSEDAYMISSIVNDVISENQMQEREYMPELIFDLDAAMPAVLLGDGKKIKKILRHLVNNAAKFTKKGGVYVRIHALHKDYGVNLCITVSDTGEGISGEELEKITEGFYQTDGGRSRRAGGLGLGLPIVAGMVSCMEGFMQIKSEEGSGTVVSVSIPQKIADKKPMITLKNRERLCLACFLKPEKYETPEVRDYYNETITHMIEGMDISIHRVFNMDELKALTEIYQITHLFIGAEEYEESSTLFEDLAGRMAVIVVADKHFVPPSGTKAKLLKKPFYCLPIANMLNAEAVQDEFSFAEKRMICPNVRVLVVDDEPMNLMVAEGIFREYEMQVRTVYSGMEAVELCRKEDFDLIFLDHMMPEMDGVETTRVIRRLLGNNGQVPIIALTANAVEGTAQMFIDEGMNDFVTKPIEMRVILAKLRKWLPPEKIEKNRNKKMNAVLQGANKDEKASQMSTDISIAGLDVKKAMEFLGNEELFWSVLKEYYRVIDKKSTLISEYEQKEMWKEYTVEVHALKSASRQIGALELAQVAEQMEAAGNAGNAALIHKITPGMLEEYMFYKGILAPYFVKAEETQNGRAAEKSEMSELFDQMKDAMENLDMDAMEEVIKGMSQYSYGDAQRSIFERLKNAVEDIDTEKCEEIIAEWKKELGK